MKALLPIILLTLLSCTKEMELPERNDVCNMKWECEWTINQFINEYGEPFEKIEYNIPLDNGHYIIDTRCLWACYSNTGDDIVPTMWLWCEFQNYRLVRWSMMEEKPILTGL